MQETQASPTSTDAQAYPAGTFCWWEIGTTDLDAARAFYTGLFGWTAHDNPMDNDEVYVMMRKDGHDVLGLYRLNEDQSAQGVPPHWLAYIAVDDADQIVSAATTHGGNALMPAFDVYDLGRMTVLRDPQGATFGIWQAGKHRGATAVSGPGTLYWTELATTDRAAAGAFYSSLFGYSVRVEDMGPMGLYSVLHKDEVFKGGILQMTEEWGDVPAHFMNYVAVEDTDAKAEQAAALGGKVCVPPTDIPGVGRFAVIDDPLGATFSIITPAPEQ